jgi:hypothetical protein
MSMNDFARYQIMEGPVPASEELRKAVADLSERSGRPFEISPQTVPGTSLYVVHTNTHDFRSEYTVAEGVLGFRVPSNFPDAGPEDNFFIAPAETRLRVPDLVRNSAELNRAGRADGYVAGSALGGMAVLVFSWHLWNNVPWNRHRHTLMDHYTHCIRRFEMAENG